jgi:hypothetical protein
MIGRVEDPNSARILHVLDFGLSRYGMRQYINAFFRAYARKENGVWLPRRARIVANFLGTRRYVSPMVHDLQEQVIFCVWLFISSDVRYRYQQARSHDWARPPPSEREKMKKNF